LPQRVENRFFYGATPAYFADYARRFAESGVRLIGGCCGTTPAHIASIAQKVGKYQPRCGHKGTLFGELALEAETA
jgi:methionine synthase I (cobalamin-dependent)